MHHCPRHRQHCTDVDSSTGAYIKKNVCFHCLRPHLLEDCDDCERWEYWRICTNRKKFLGGVSIRGNIYRNPAIKGPLRRHTEHILVNSKIHATHAKCTCKRSTYLGQDYPTNHFSI